jgi:hypothetical protein
MMNRIALSASLFTLLACDPEVPDADGEITPVGPILKVDGVPTTRIELMPGQEVDLEAELLNGYEDVHFQWMTTMEDGRLTDEDSNFAELTAGLTPGTYYVVCRVEAKDVFGEKRRGAADLEVVVLPTAPSRGVIDNITIDGGHREYGGTTNIVAGRTIDVWVLETPGATGVTVEGTASGGRLTKDGTQHFIWNLPAMPGADLRIDLMVRGRVLGTNITEAYTHFIHLD